MKRIIPMVFLLLFLLTSCAPQGEVPSVHPPVSSETGSPQPAVSPSPSPNGTGEPEQTVKPADPTPSAEVTPTPEPVEEKEITLYLPNETVDGFVEVRERVKVDPQSVVDALIARKALPEGTKVLEFRLEEAESHIVLDVSREFETALCSMGTSGEAMLMGSLVNTLLTCWEADTLSVTSEGAIIESGHVVYDFPLSFSNMG